MDFINQVICGDCREVLKQIPDESVDLVLTDPPYGINAHAYIVGDDSLDTYYSVLPELYRIMKPNTFFISFVGMPNLPQYFKNNPFRYKHMMFLYINNGMVCSKIGFANLIPVILFEKGEAKVKHRMRDVMEKSTTAKEMNKREHPYQKDEDFISYLIAGTSDTNAVVLDPFCGVGSVQCACINTERNFIGIEISQKYCEIARKRIEKAQQSKSYKLETFQ